MPARAPAKPKAKPTKSAKLDLYKAFADEYVMPRDPVFVQVGRAYYLSVEGEGAPDSPKFAEAIGALYNVAFTIKMARKFAGSDYAVAKLEGLWWVNLPDVNILMTPRARWQCKLLIRIPDFITAAEVSRAIAQLIARGKPSTVKQVKRISLTEGKCVQMLHVGSYAEEVTSIGRMRAFAEERHHTFRGTHHEIYLSDPRRVPPTRLKTLLRQPVGVDR
jgi:hypothetical protein